MPFYQKNGKIPSKRHVQFRNQSNNLIWEELVSRNGFSGIYSNLYHRNPPTAIREIGKLKKINLNSNIEVHRHHHFKTRKIKLGGDLISSRIPLLFNDDLVIYKAHIDRSMKNLYKNGHGDEIIYIQNGNGLLMSNFGCLNFSEGDYIIIPKGVIWKAEIIEETRALIIESKYPLKTPNRYRNTFGQLLEHSPFCERDIKTPNFKEQSIENSCTIDIKLKNGIQSYSYKFHPFDLVGWDGYYFPWIFNINDFMPITGKIHQPPPVHQTFQSKSFVICSFVPRLFDYHQDSIPAPYAHSNIDSDEVIFYSKGNFMSRKGISCESITYHPSGLPHGPQPGKIEESLNKRETDELAVMIDTFKPLKISDLALKIDDEKYPYSWLKK